MEPISEAASRAVESLLDEMVDLLSTMPEGRAKTELAGRVNRLEEALLALKPPN